MCLLAGPYLARGQLGDQLDLSRSHPPQVSRRFARRAQGQLAATPVEKCPTGTSVCADGGPMLRRRWAGMLVYAAITVAGAATGRAQEGAFPYFGSPISLPGTVNAQDYDDGGGGVSYYDTSGGNNGGAYRGGDVDLEPSSDGGNDIGWIDPGEWL